MLRFPRGKLKIRVFIYSMLTLVLFNAIFMSTYASSIGDWSSELNNVKALINVYEREEAYYKLLDMSESMSYEADGVEYLEVLSLLTQLAYYYWEVDVLTEKAIELYNLSMGDKEYHYMMVALERLAHIDYYNYDNKKSLEKLGQLAGLESVSGEGAHIIEYYIGIARLLMDEQNYEKAIKELEDALKLPESRSYSDIKQKNTAQIYYQIGMVYISDENFVEAIKAFEKALLEIDSNDIESLTEYRIALIDTYIDIDDYGLAKAEYELLVASYENTSELFKMLYSQKDIDIYEANIAFYDEDYKTAAFLYNIYNQNDYESEAEYLEDNLAAQEARSEFEESIVEEQFSIYKQYEEGQQKIIRMYQKGLLALSFFVVIILVILYLLLNQKKKLHVLSVTDQLTNMSNRRKIMSDLEEIPKGNSVVALLDLDNFKHINDTYGHVIGDEVLRKVSKVMMKHMGDEHLVGRYGGEEFLFVIKTTSLKEGSNILRGIIKAIEEIHWEIEGLRTTASVGAIFSNSLSSDEMLSEADHALYEAKANGKNECVCRFV